MTTATSAQKHISTVMALLLCTSINAEVLIAAIGRITQETQPVNTATIQKVLKGSGYQFKFVTLPSKRGLYQLSRGEIAIDLYRTPTAVAEVPNIIRINPAVGELAMWLTTANPQLCNEVTNDFTQHSVVGIRGANYFDEFYPKFKQHYISNSFDAAIKMLVRHRGDFTIAASNAFLQAKNRIGVQLHACGRKPLTTLNFYSYIHKKFAWAIPNIEQAYRRNFVAQAYKQGSR